MIYKDIESLLCNEQIMLIAIMLNTVIMFIGGFWPNSLFLELSDALFTLIFLCEAIVKILKYGWHGYWKYGWNKFDFLVLVIALPTIASPFFDHTATSTILALRSMRLFKSFKMLRFIPNIHKLLKGIKLAFRASLLVLIAFIVFLVLFSIMSSTLFGSIAPEYFENPAISLYSIFRLFSVEGWYELPDAIAKKGSPLLGLFARCYFSILMFLGGIIGMSLINSIFVDAMAEDNNDEVLEKLEHIEHKLEELEKSNTNYGCKKNN